MKGLIASVRDLIGDFSPRRFADNLPASPSWGFRQLWAYGAIVDAFTQWQEEGVRARFPGLGTPTALPAIARSRSIVRGRVETDDEHIARLIAWLDIHATRGTMRGITKEIQNYLGRTNGGQWFKVTCVSRGSLWGVRRENGEYEFIDPGTGEGWFWDWDSISHPENATCSTDMWIIVEPTVYAAHLAWWWPSPDSSLGHDAPQVEVSAIREIVDRFRAERTRIRALIWSPGIVPAGYPQSGQTIFDPTADGTQPQLMPSGDWGSWSKIVDGKSVPSRPNYLRFWHF